MEQTEKETKVFPLTIIPAENGACGLGLCVSVEKGTRKLEKGKEETIYTLYDKEGNTIGIVDEQGNLEFNEDFLQSLKEKMGPDFALLNLENRKIYMDIDKLEEIITLQEEAKKQEETGEKKKETLGTKAKEKEKSPEEEKKQAEKDLDLPEGDIISYTEIVDPAFIKKVPQAANFAHSYLVYSKSTNTFQLMGERGGEFRRFNGIKPSEATTPGDTTIDTNYTGEKIEKKPLSAVMQVTDDVHFDFGITMNQVTGEIELKDLNYDTVTGQYTSIPVTMETEQQYPNTREVEELMEKNKNPEMTDEVKQYEKKEEKQGKNINVQEMQAKTNEIGATIDKIRQQAKEMLDNGESREAINGFIENTCYMLLPDKGASQEYIKNAVKEIRNEIRDDARIPERGERRPQYISDKDE